MYRSYTHFIRFHTISPKAIICRSVSLCPNMVAKRIQNTAFEKFQQFSLISGEYKPITKERKRGGEEERRFSFMKQFISTLRWWKITYNVQFRMLAQSELFYPIHWYLIDLYYSWDFHVVQIAVKSRRRVEKWMESIRTISQYSLSN